MRPQLDPTFLAAAEKAYEDARRNPPPGLEILKHADALVLGVFKEVMISGWWLEQRLINELGFKPEECRPVCFNHGRLSLGRCPWDVAEAVFQATKKETAHAREDDRTPREGELVETPEDRRDLPRRGDR